jgi:tRNA G18 (ribose-2'-O)-methylase SpoU
MIHRAVSPGDPRLEPFRHVGDHGWLAGRNLFVAEGRLVVGRLLDPPADRERAGGGHGPGDPGRFGIASVLVTAPALAALEGPLAGLDADVFVCDAATLAAVTGFSFHQGCLALARRPTPTSPGSLHGASTLLALEAVGNPDNIGGLFRTAAAFGAGGLLLDGTCGDPFYRKAIRTSMGAVLRLPFARLPDWPAGLEPFRARGFRLVALTPDPAAEPVRQFAAGLPADARVILLVGAEGSGLSRVVLSHADARVRIPIDAAVDSLNVTVAAAVALERLASRG